MKPVTRTLLFMALAVLLPLIAAVIWFLLGAPGATMNHGELLEVKPIPAVKALTLNGSAFHSDSLKGKWVMLQVDGGACDADCRTKLYSMRQARAAQGKHQERVVRVWLIDDDAQPPADIMREYEGTLVLRHADPALLHALPAPQGPDAHIYVIDPLGNLILRYPPAADIKGMVVDLDRLLRASRIG